MQPRVEAYRLKNFMAFADTGWIELRPITLLFGRNSSGKSVLIRALRLLRQSLEAPPGEGPFLFTSEDGVDLESFATILHDQTPDKEGVQTMGLGFRCSLSGSVSDALRDSVNTRRIAFGQEPISSNDWENWVEMECVFQRHLEGGRITLRDITLTGPWGAMDEQQAHTLFAGYQIADDLQSATSLEEWQFHSDFLQGHELDGIEASWSGLSVELTEGFLPVLKGGNPNMGSGAREDHQLLDRLLQELRSIISNFLRTMTHLGPVRPDPQRVYVLNPVTREHWRRQGLDAFARFLLDEADDETLSTVNRWLQHVFENMVDRVDERKRFYYVDRDHLAVAQLRLYEPGQKDPRNIADMGYGFAQVFPIIAQSILTKGNQLTIIEQPELHLHPRAQAQLADMFIERIFKTIKEKGDLEGDRSKRVLDEMRFIVETHSEHIALRLRKQIAHSYLQELKEKEIHKPVVRRFQPVDLAIYFIERGTDGSTVHTMKVDEYGDFLQVPAGFTEFFADDALEIMEMTDAAFKAQRIARGQVS